eukprot:7420424-Pyramimonas_sp.AAC.1
MHRRCIGDAAQSSDPICSSLDPKGSISRFWGTRDSDAAAPGNSPRVRHDQCFEAESGRGDE